MNNYPSHFAGKLVYYGTTDGYPRVWWPEHPLAWANGQVPVHRAVAYSKYAEIPEGYHVHHIDEDRRNWHPDNLELISASEHSRLHYPSKLQLVNHQQQPGKLIGRVCDFCWAKFTVTQGRSKRRKYCSPGCSNLASQKISWPEDEELLERLAASNFSALARELGVSDNAIRKRLKVYTGS